MEGVFRLLHLGEKRIGNTTKHKCSSVSLAISNDWFEEVTFLIIERTRLIIPRKEVNIR